MRYKHEIEEDLADAQFHLEELETALKKNQRSSSRLPLQIDQTEKRIEELKKELHETD